MVFGVKVVIINPQAKPEPYCNYQIQLIVNGCIDGGVSTSCVHFIKCLNNDVCEILQTHRNTFIQILTDVHTQKHLEG